MKWVFMKCTRALWIIGFSCPFNFWRQIQAQTFMLTFRFDCFGGAIRSLSVHQYACQVTCDYSASLFLKPLHYGKQRKWLVGMGQNGTLMIFHITWTFADAGLSVQGTSQSCFSSRICHPYRPYTTSSVILTFPGLLTHCHELILTPLWIIRSSRWRRLKEPALLTSPQAPYLHGC